jgi:hypothetical protein
VEDNGRHSFLAQSHLDRSDFNGGPGVEKLI